MSKSRERPQTMSDRSTGTTALRPKADIRVIGY